MENLIVVRDRPTAVRIPARGRCCDSAGEILGAGARTQNTGDRRHKNMRSIDWLQLALFVGALAVITETHGALSRPGVPDAKGQDLARPGAQTP